MNVPKLHWLPTPPNLVQLNVSIHTAKKLKELGSNIIKLHHCKDLFSDLSWGDIFAPLWFESRLNWAAPVENALKHKRIQVK